MQTKVRFLSCSNIIMGGIPRLGWPRMHGVLAGFRLAGDARGVDAWFWLVSGRVSVRDGWTDKISALPYAAVMVEEETNSLQTIYLLAISHISKGVSYRISFKYRLRSVADPGIQRGEGNNMLQIAPAIFSRPRLRFIYTERKRTWKRFLLWSLLLAAKCEHQIGFSMNPSGSDVTFAVLPI